jgi:hypothetical protein
MRKSGGVKTYGVIRRKKAVIHQWKSEAGLPKEPGPSPYFDSLGRLPDSKIGRDWPRSFPANHSS